MGAADLLQALSRLKRVMPRNEDIHVIDREVSELLLGTKGQPKEVKADRKAYLKAYMRDYMRRYRLNKRVPSHRT